MNKTKKALLAALACSVAVAGACGLAACGGGDGGNGGHSHEWNAWTVATAPTSETAGKATRTCKNDGCDAKATDKEATLPVLSRTDYTITNDTATCQAVGTATYTYNKDGVNVSFSAATPVNPENHTADCGHGQPAAHSHVWGPWVVDEDAHQGYAGTASRECTGAGDCDADESLTFVNIPSVIYGDEYTYAEPVHKTTATCKVEGVDTYTYTDTEKGISISFDVYTGYADHVFENNECTVCHKTVTVLTLDTEVTVNATAEESLYSFTATKAGKYEIVYTQGEGAKVVINQSVITQLPYSNSLDAGEKITLAISAPQGEESATYKIKVIPVTELEADYGTEENPKDPTETPTTVTVNVGGGKTARVDVRGRGYGIISYTGNTPIVVTYSEYDWYQGKEIEYTNTLVGGGQEHFVLPFGYPVGGFNLTVSSEAGEAFNAQISLLLAEEDPDAKYVITVGEEKSFEGVDYMNALVYDLVITDEGNYNITIGGDNVTDVEFAIGTGYDPDEDPYAVTGELTANEDGSYTLAAGTYKVLLFTMNGDMEGTEYVTFDGTVTVAKVEEEGDNPTVGEPFEVSLGMEWSKAFTVELEEGDYQIIIDGEAITLDQAADVLIGSGYEQGGFGDELIMLETKAGSDDKVVTVTAGTYYLEVYADVTFTIVKVEA